MNAAKIYKSMITITFFLINALLFASEHQRLSSDSLENNEPSFQEELIPKYGLCFKNNDHYSITKLFVISERCSGSNYVNALVLRNFYIIENHLGHKHFPPWYNLSIEHYEGDSRYYNFLDTEDYLFIVVFRNPYDWLRSIYRNPWHADKSLSNSSFSQFIRTPWKLDPNENALLKRDLFPLLDLDPATGLPFKNVIELRTAKIKNMLKIKNLASNVYYINYEIANQYPQEVIEEIQSIFSLDKIEGYEPVIFNKGDPKLGQYKQTTYDPLSQLDLNYINSQLDSTLENAIGYQLIYDPEAL